MSSRYRSQRGCILFTFLIVSIPHGALQGQVVGPLKSASSPPLSPGAGFSGKWTYRSFISDPMMSDPDAPLKTLLFGQGTLVITVDGAGTVSGTLGGDGWELNLAGTVRLGHPSVVRFQGKGTIAGEQWVYDYIGYAVPKWPNGVDQRPAIVGTIVRTVPHSNGSGGISPAGYVAQWIAVQQDSGNAKEMAKASPAGAKEAEQQVRQLEASWAAAVITHDPNKIGQLFSDDFAFVGPNGVLQDRNQHLEDFRSGKLKIESMTIQTIQVNIYDSVAVATVVASVKGAFDGHDIAGTYDFLDTWRLIHGRWLATARKQKKVPMTPALQGYRTPNTPVPPLLRQKYIEEQNRESAIDQTPRVQDFLPTLGSSSLKPETIHSINGRLDVTLEVKYETVHIGNDAVRLRTYNGKLIGPVLRAKAGDVLYITLINSLPPEQSSSHVPNGHHDWNTTNLHFHGLHVAPQGPPNQPDAESDNVLLELKPSRPFNPTVSVQKYQVKIPGDHVAGTFWYHAHKHGSVAAQVSSGMAGALIIERDDNSHNLDSVPEIAAATEELLVLQEIPYLKGLGDPWGQIEVPSSGDPEPNLTAMFAPGAFRDLKRYITVNGLRIPTITMSPGEVRRLRFVYTGQRESVSLRIERAPNTIGTGDSGLELHEIAVDGLPSGTIRTISQASAIARDRALELYPGYRSDVLLQAPANALGVFYLVDTRGDANGVPRPDSGGDGSPELVRWVAKLVVSGPPKAMSLPQAAALAPHRLTDLVPSTATGAQYAFYGIDFSDNGGFFVSRSDLSQTLTPVSPSNAKSYDPSDARLLRLSNVDRWLVGSRNGELQGQLAGVTHPFHIHTNPFLITKVTRLDSMGDQVVQVDVTADEIGLPTWRDTLAMKQGYTYDLLTRYNDFVGKFVDHCHILDHEDRGMMDLVQIITPSSPPPPRGLEAHTTWFPPAPGTTSVLLFVKGSFCAHCMSELSAIVKPLTSRPVTVFVITASGEDDLKAFPATPFHLIADPDLKLFKRYGILEGQPRHGTLVLDSKGKEVFRYVADQPLSDTASVIQAIDGTRVPASSASR